MTLVLASACAKNSSSPTSPTGPPQAGSTIVYAAVGASDVTGVGSSVICPPYTDCPNGTGYAFVAARSLRGGGFTVNVSNLGIPSGVISRHFQDLGAQFGRSIFGNFIEQEGPFVPSDSTVVSIFAGANEVNVITSALAGGAGGADGAAYIDEQVRTFGADVGRLMDIVRGRARNARFVILNVPNLAAMPFLNGASTPQRQAAQRASVRMTTTVINPLASSNVSIIDLMCDTRFYDRSNYSGDGFHPNDRGYAIIGDELARAIANGAFPAPNASCAPMTAVP
jgi:lysophospholipase L1-like esterase